MCEVIVRAWARVGENGEFVRFGQVLKKLPRNSAPSAVKSCSLQDLFTDDVYNDLFENLAKALAYESEIDENASSSPFTPTVGANLKDFFWPIIQSSQGFISNKKLQKEVSQNVSEAAYRKIKDNNANFILALKDYLKRILVKDVRKGTTTNNYESRSIIGIYNLGGWKILHSESQNNHNTSTAVPKFLNLFFLRACQVQLDASQAKWLNTTSQNQALNPFSCQVKYFKDLSFSSDKLFFQPGNKLLELQGNQANLDDTLLFTQLGVSEDYLLGKNGRIIQGGDHKFTPLEVTTKPTVSIEDVFKEQKGDDQSKDVKQMLQEAEQTAVYLRKITPLTPVMLHATNLLNKNMKRMDALNQALFARSDATFNTDILELETLACETMYLFQTLQAFRYRLSKEPKKAKEILDSFGRALSQTRSPFTVKDKENLMKYYEAFYKEETLKHFALMVSTKTSPGLFNSLAKFASQSTQYLLKQVQSLLVFPDAGDVVLEALSRSWLGFSGIGLSHFSWAGSTSIEIGAKNVQALTIANEIEMATEYTDRVIANFALLEQTRQNEVR